jgi:ABC-2 type transport system permease protein
LEYLFVDAIRLLNRTEVRKIAFIEGHGELTEEYTYDASDALSRYFQVDRGVLGMDASVLDDYAAIIIAKPTEKYSESDKFIIDQYIMRGGRVLWMLDGAQMSSDMLSEGGATPLIALDVNLNDQLFRYGVRLTPTIVEDMQCAYMPINVARPTEQPRFEPIPWFYTPLLQGSPYHPSG